MSFAKPGTKPPKPVPIRGRGAARRKPSKEDEVSERERRYLEELGAIFKKKTMSEIPHDDDADAFALSSSPIDAGKEVDRNTAYLQREKDALDVLQRERSANSPVPKQRPMPPGAYPNATEEANHVVVDPAQIPGLGGGGHGERRHFASPNDGGIRAYPSWDDNVGGYTIPAGGVAKMAALSEEMDHLDAAEYERLAGAGGVETLAPDHAVHAAAVAHAHRPLAPSPGAFPGHLPENPDYFNDRRMKRTPGPVSFSVAGVDPVEFSRDPRAAAEARIRQEKRDRLRAELDEQVRLKKERERLIKEADDAREKAEVGRVSHYDRWGKRGGGGEPLVDDRGHLIAELKGVDIRSPANAQAAAAAASNAMNESLSPGRVAEIVGYPGGDQRAPMAGVPRRGVNPGAGEYSSPFRRAGGGPSSFYLGGEVNAGPNDLGKVTGAHHTAAELSMAEVKRLQLIKDLDEQVRIKKEQERIRALEEAIQEAKIERRIQETIEEERRVLALKEAQMAAMNGGEYDEHGDVGFTGDAAVTTVTTAGGGRVMNSPPAPPRPLTGTEPEPGMPGEDFGDFVGDVVLDDGLEDFEPPPPASDEAVTTVTTAGGSEAAAAGDDDTFIPASASPAPAPRPSKVIHSPPASVDPKPIANRQLDFGDVPGLEGHVPSRVVHSPPPGSPPPSPPRADRDLGSLRSSRQFDRDRNFEMDRYHHRSNRPTSAHTPQLRDMVAELEADKRRLQEELDGKRRQLHEAQWEAAHAARERDLAERERDLEAQLAAVRAQLAAAPRGAGGSRGSSRPVSAAPSLRASRDKPPVRLSAEGIREPVRVSMDDYDAPTVTIDRYNRPYAPASAADAGVTDLNALEEFVVSSKFVRADAPLGAVPGGGNVNVVAKGHTVRPSELARARKMGDVGAGAAAKTPPPQRAIGPNYTVPDRAPRVAGLQRRAVRGVRPKRDENEPVGKPVWGANRPKSRAIRWT